MYGALNGHEEGKVAWNNAVTHALGAGLLLWAGLRKEKKD